jgi:hypothetical protein
MASDFERIVGEHYLDDLERLPIEELRAKRNECQGIETGLSYLRRLAQGRLDVVAVEQARRRAGAPACDLAQLVSELPATLADRTRNPGVGRLPTMLDPGELDESWTAELDGIVAGFDIETLPTLGDDDVESLRRRLEDYEHHISAQRREVFDHVDALQAELTRRYRTGEASVESLLR